MKSIVSMPGLKPNFSKRMKNLKISEKDRILIDQRCENCSEHTEETALTLEGVNKANFDHENGMLTVDFNPAILSLGDIEKAIADAGHSTPNHKAKIDFYTDAPECCRLSLEREKDRV